MRGGVREEEASRVRCNEGWSKGRGSVEGVMTGGIWEGSVEGCNEGWSKHSCQVCRKKVR